MRLVRLLPTAWLMAAPLLKAQSSNAVDSSAIELADLDRRWQEAVVLGDATFIEDRTTDDFVFTHGNARKDTKPDWVRITKRVPQPFLQRKVSSQLVEVHGAVALVFGRLDVRQRSADSVSRCNALEYVHLYARQGGRWQLVSHRTTHSLEPPHPCN